MIRFQTKKKFNERAHAISIYYFKTPKKEVEIILELIPEVRKKGRNG